MSEFSVFAFCAAMGFVVAGTVASFYKWMTSEPADFSLARSGPVGLLITVLLSMFGGPFIVVQKVFSGVKAKQLSAVPALFGVAIAGMWSVCAGIFVVSLLIAA